MKLSHSIANILTLLGAFSLFGAIVVKIFHIKVFYLVPMSFFNFANTCLLLGIAIYIREIVIRGKRTD